MSMALASAALFGAGLTATVSPCVLPLVPGYLGVLADSDVPGLTGARPARVALFALGAAATFAALGAVVGSLGWGVTRAGDSLQQISGIALIVFGILMLLGRLGTIGGERRLIDRLPRQPQLRALMLGVGCGAAWSPCVGPLLGAALTAAGGSGSVARGSLLLLAFAAGVLAPFVALSFVRTPRVPFRVRRLGNAMSSASAMLMLALGVLLAAGWYDSLIQRLPSGT